MALSLQEAMIMLTQAQQRVNLRQTVTGWYLRTIQLMSIMNEDGVVFMTDYAGAKLVSVTEYTFAPGELAGCLRVKKELEESVWKLEASLLFMMLSAQNAAHEMLATRYVAVTPMPSLIPREQESDSEESDEYGPPNGPQRLARFDRQVRRRM